MGAINVITLQGYYYLYALFFDYPINNAFFTNVENRDRVIESLRTVQRLQAMRQPYRKSWAVRLFTERDAMARFSPELVNVVLYQLRELVEQIGPPPGWSRGPLPTMRPPRTGSRLGRWKDDPPEVSAPRGAGASFSRSPIPIRLTA